MICKSKALGKSSVFQDVFTRAFTIYHAISNLFKEGKKTKKKILQKHLCKSNNDLCTS